MTSKRKYMRVAIPADMHQLFNDAKQAAENKLMVTLSDTQYAGRLIQWALSQQGKKSDALTIDNCWDLKVGDIIKASGKIWVIEDIDTKNHSDYPFRVIDTTGKRGALKLYMGKKMFELISRPSSALSKGEAK